MEYLNNNFSKKNQGADAVKRGFSVLQNEFVVIGKTRVHSWVAWLLIGLAAGLVFAFIFSANQSGRFDLTLAEDQGIKQSTNVQFAPGELLLKFNDNISPTDKAKQLKAWGLVQKDEIRQIKVKILEVPEGAEEQLAQALSRNPKVKFAEVNGIVKPSFIPNDPQLSSEWHIYTINAPAAWDSSNGSGVTVAIADTGVNPVSDLAANLVPGWNFYDNNSNTGDVNGHGTMVAGTEAAIGNNSNQVAGVAWNTKIMPLRVSNPTGYAYYSTISQAATYAADHGAKTMNVSFGGVCASATLANAGSYMNSKGAWFVAAGDNTGANTGCSSVPSIIFASATDGSDNLASWSSYGNDMVVSAPGVGICTTDSSGGVSCPSGTSFSSPIAAGVLALEWAANPALTPSQAESILESTAVDLGAPGWDMYYGWGRVNAGAAVAAAAAGAPPPDTTSPTASISSPSNGSIVFGTISVSVSASDNVGVTKVELYKDGTLFATDASSPYGFTWDTLNDTNGSHTLMAKAYDSAGNVGSSASITVNVNNIADTIAPSVNITSPTANSMLPKKGTLKISASASDNVGVVKIDLLFDGKLVTECLNVTSCSGSMNVNKVVSGPHTISAIAYDAAGNSTSALISVTK